jgi:hypothetical protein
MNEDDGTPLASAYSEFNAALTANNLSQNAARQTRATKDDKRAALVQNIRSLANRVQACPQTTDAQRTMLGLTVRDTTPTRIAAPTTQPALFVDTSNRLQHGIQFKDSLTPNSKAKPAGVLGMEIYRKVDGAPPADLGQCDFVAMDTATPYVVEYSGALAGKTVYYIGRWVNRNGEAGPISDVISATVVG